MCEDTGSGAPTQMVVTSKKRGRIVSEANGNAAQDIKSEETVDETTRRLRELFASGQLGFDSEVDEGLDECGLDEVAITVTSDEVEVARTEFHRRKQNG
jgi:hypothetical protein